MATILNHCNGNFRRLFYARSATKHIQCSWDKVDVYNVIMLIKVMTKVFSKAGRRMSLFFTHMASAWVAWKMADVDFKYLLRSSDIFIILIRYL